MSAETLTESTPDVLGKVRFFTYVLSYDDLLAASSSSISLHDVERSFVLGRSERPGPPRFETRALLGMFDHFMSRRHAAFERRGGEDWVRDLESRNGTFVNGHRVCEQRLSDGDLVEVGHSLFCYRVIDAALATRLAAPEAQLRLGPTRTFNAEVAALIADLRCVAPSPENILLLGETGVGKEIAARAVHELAGRSGGFRPVDCGAVPDSLFESTFFGHRRGAYTGATHDRAGEIVGADGGTIFLDEVGNMTVTSQAKLLRVIESQVVTPLGATEAIKVDARWVSATNRDLFAPDSGFRPDLLRRLAGHVVRLPPLRKRREDLGVLSAHLLREAGVERASISAIAARKLFAGSFPGNIRQLRAQLRRAALLAGNGPILAAHVEEEASVQQTAPATVEVNDAAASEPVAPTRDEVLAALEATRGNVVRAAKLLHTHPRQLYRWIDRHGLDLETFRVIRSS